MRGISCAWNDVKSISKALNKILIKEHIVTFKYSCLNLVTIYIF